MKLTRNSDIFGNFVQFNRQVTGHPFSFALFAAFISAWAITGPNLNLGGRVIPMRKRVPADSETHSTHET
jgi:hypothetical protein